MGKPGSQLSGPTLLPKSILNQRGLPIFKPELIFMQILCIYAKKMHYFFTLPMLLIYSSVTHGARHSSWKRRMIQRTHGPSGESPSGNSRSETAATFIRGVKIYKPIQHRKPAKNALEGVCFYSFWDYTKFLNLEVMMVIFCSFSFFVSIRNIPTCGDRLVGFLEPNGRPTWGSKISTN